MRNPVFVIRNTSFGKKRPHGRIPLLVPWKLKWPVGIALLFLSSGLYLISDYFPMITPRKLPLTWIDRSIPFVPDSIWIYVSLYLYIPYVYLLNRCSVSLNKHLYSFLFSILFSIVCFWLFPIAYPRELFPLPEDTGGITQFIFQVLRSVDRPNNCSPSLHVALAYQIAFGFLEDQKRYFPLFIVWATALSVSTMTTKQHYFSDVVSGLVLAVFVHILFHHILSFHAHWRTASSTPQRIAL